MNPTIPSSSLPPRRAPCRGFTLIELLVVISIISVLAGMLIPAVTLVKESANQAKCGNNQRQIVLAMSVYAHSNDGLWPARPTLPDGSQDAANPAPAALPTAIGSFELLVAQVGELPRQLFCCPSEPRYRPTAAAEPTLDLAGPAISAWTRGVTGVGGSQLACPGYAYDWSVPANANSMRVVTADRGVGGLGHRKLVVACFVDGHVGKLPRASGTPTAPTANLDGTAVSGWVYANPDEGGENIYDSAGDDGVMTATGAGSPTRCWVR